MAARTRLDPALAVAVVVVAGLSGCGDKSKRKLQDPAAFSAIPAPATVTRAVTWHADVRPLVEARCATCHYDDGPGPYPLQSYDDVKSHAAVVRDAIVGRRMPPFLGISSCNEYENDYSLTDEQRGVITAWIDQGMPEGDAAAPGPALPTFARDLTRTDLTVGMSEGYKPQNEGGDDYRCFVLDWPLAAPAFVTGLSVTPGNKSVVHHVLVFSVPAEKAAEIAALDAADPGYGYTCFGGPGVSTERMSLLGAWVPGIGSGDYPKGSGIPVLPGTKLVMQMHYNTSGIKYGLHGGKGEPDQTSLRLMLEQTVASPAGVMPVVNPLWIQKPETMLIPAKTNGVVRSFAFDPTLLSGDKPFTIRRTTMHQHVLGTRAKLTLQRADGSEQCLLDIPRWDFGWQLGYDLKNPVVVNPGDMVRIDCEWSNPGATDVTWGEGTKDEMCLGGLFVTY